ncbi:dienelactone hydrolase family protein [Erythrobacter litoralis]|uniref:Putative hydrolase n=1 Tax=Erythrobacter litoralis (strain HTCC2594) TaxID=314225 RepID=Q2N5N6_ERYLH|nr:dienelactone hydrolase family protein [Erythrobacter litoralis]ABC65005.1 putative hydrolase [Erythrobacter litoralis HTCC2594]
MCDERDFAEWDRKIAAKGLSRREFGALTGAAALAACAGGETVAVEASMDASGLVENRVLIDTEDGEMDAFFVHPSAGKYPAVIVWPDIASLRESKRNIARRLAGQGYAVLVANPYYRDVPGDRFESSVQFREAGGFQLVRPWREKLSSDAVMRDADALVSWLDGREAVDSERGIGTQGYCMGGPFTVYTAHSRPDRVKAAASFHGGGLVREDEDSPHKILEDGTSYLFAIAQNDDERDPDDKTALREAAEAAGVDAEVEVYAGDHGWTVPDNPAYVEGPAEKAWSRLLALYEEAL